MAVAYVAKLDHDPYAAQVLSVRFLPEKAPMSFSFRFFGYVISFGIVKVRKIPNDRWESLSK